MRRAAPGIELGDHLLDRFLGRGGMGEVWSARHRGTGVQVAVKLLTTEVAGDERARMGLLAEVRSTARLDHPNVVVVLDQGVAPEGHPLAGSPWLAMELATADLLKVAPSGWEGVRSALVQVCHGLAHVHARGMIHRDLKPENVLLVGDRWKIADLGIAHALGRTASDGVARTAGSPAYMAPEQLRGDLEAQGPWTDLYALGCMAWELLHGAPPFVRESVTQVARAHLYEPIPAWRAAHAPVGTRDLILALLAKEPADRPAFAADVLAALQALPEAAAADGSSDVARVASHTWFTLDDPEISLGHGELPDVAEVHRLEAAPAPADWRHGSPTEAVVPRYSAELALVGLRNPRLIGREDERDALWTALGAVRASGRAALAVVTGPPGSGRTALLGWLAETAIETGAAHVVRRGGASAEGLPAPRATERPHLVLVDDVSDDGEAVDFAAFHLASRAFSSWPVLFVASARPGEAPLERLVAAAGDAVRVVEIAAMPDAAIESLIAHLVRLEERTALEVLAASGGSPGVAVEVVAALARSGGLQPGPDGYTLLGEVDAGLLVGVGAAQEAALEAALAGASEDDLRALGFAAAVDAPVDGTLRARADAGGVRLRPGLVADLALHGVVQGTPERWRVSGGVRRILAARLGPEGWARVCADAAALLEGDAHTRAVAGLLWFEAGEDRRGLELVMRVSDEEGVGGLRVRTRYYEECAEVLERLAVGPDERIRGVVLRRLCGHANQRGQIGENERYANELLVLARRNHWVEDEAAALRDLASVAMMRGERDALRYYRQAWALVQQSDSPVTRGNTLLGFLGGLLFGGPAELDEAEALLNDWLASVERGGRLWTPFYRQRAMLRLRRGDFDGALADARETLAWDVAGGRHHAAAFSRQLVGLFLLDRERVDEAEGELELALESFQQTGNFHGIRNGLVNRAEVALRRGDLATASDLAGQAFEVSRAITAECIEPAHVLAEVALRRCLPLSSDLVRLVEEGIDFDRPEVRVRAWLLRAWLALPDEGRWRREVEQMEREAAPERYLPSMIPWGLDGMAAAWVGEGRDDLAAACRAVEARFRACGPAPGPG